mmetsp:Transcript_2025/g.6318  ORF Transcript_2025/g.6318 Transcript_2025/m.6318 type:complete len:201 (-) Transcript_2025:1103-1705(-)
MCRINVASKQHRQRQSITAVDRVDSLNKIALETHTARRGRMEVHHPLDHPRKPDEAKMNVLHRGRRDGQAETEHDLASHIRAGRCSTNSQLCRQLLPLACISRVHRADVVSNLCVLDSVRRMEGVHQSRHNGEEAGNLGHGDNHGCCRRVTRHRRKPPHKESVRQLVVRADEAMHIGGVSRPRHCKGAVLTLEANSRNVG